MVWVINPKNEKILNRIDLYCYGKELTIIKKVIETLVQTKRITLFIVSISSLFLKTIWSYSQSLTHTPKIAHTYSTPAL